MIKYKKSNLNNHLNINNLIKKKSFIIKNLFFLKNIKLNYYCKRDWKFFKRKLYSDFIHIFRKLEFISGILPDFKSISIRIKNYKKKKNKKKIKKRSYSVIFCNIYNNTSNFVDFFIINNYILKIKKLFKLKKKYKINQQFISRAYYDSFNFNNDNITFNIEMFSQIFLNFKLKKCKSHPNYNKKIDFKFIPFSISFEKKKLLVFFKLMSILVLNELKLILLLFKLNRNKLVKI